MFLAADSMQFFGIKNFQMQAFVLVVPNQPLLAPNMSLAYVVGKALNCKKKVLIGLNPWILY